SLRLIRVGQLADAEAALQSFLKDYPKDDLAGNAQYWLGETYYARNEYEQAAAAFLAGYRNHPKSQKAPDNLLKLGVSLVAMGQKAEACPVFSNLLSEFPNAPRLILDRARSEQQRAGC
ncbi:tol-pal system protein YbgF, partial [Marinibaculum pumilum]